jgi:hypothetical protein
MNEAVLTHLALPKSKLTFENGVVTKRGQENAVVAHHSLSDIRKVDVIQKVDPLGITFLVVGAALAYLCKAYIPSDLWSWIAALVFVGVSFLGLFAIKKAQIRFECSAGTAAYDVLDTYEDAQGFAVSLQSLLGDHRDGQMK